jgi:hypothetical protein
MEMTTYQWMTLGLGALGFLATWLLGAFKLGRVVEQMRAAIKEDIDRERDKILSTISDLKDDFEDSQRAQDHNFGEVGAAMRQYIADVEKKVREVEIYGRDNYVQKSEFEKATDRLEAAIKAWGAEIKEDLRDRLDDLRKSFDAKH